MSAITATFDELAESYAEFRTGYSGELFETLAERGFAPGMHVLDLACGTGIATRELAALGCIVTGVDPSEPMLQRARAAMPAGSHATFVTGRAEALPFGDASFDASACAQAFHWFDRPAALRELARVVRPGGTIAVWWKSLMRGDSIWLEREAAALSAGLEPTRDVMEGGFPEFDEAPLEAQRLHVIPWLVTMPVERFIGYERSRARSKAAYGEKLADYLTELERLLAGRGPLQLNYIQYLFLARVPERAQ